LILAYHLLAKAVGGVDNALHRWWVLRITANDASAGERQAR